MAKDLNSTIISGRLGADPELRYTDGGSSVVNFRIAASRPYRRDGDKDWSEETTWVGIVAWGALAERVNDSFGKGDRVVISGRLREETWKEKDSGKNRSRITIVADSVQPMGDWRDFAGKGPGSSRDDDDDQPTGGDAFDDLPF